MNLYDINSLYNEALASAIDDQGEILDERLVELLDEIAEARDQKIENILCLIKDIEADTGKFESEIKRLEARKKAMENKASSLKLYLARNIEPGEKFESTRAKLSWRKSSAVEITEDLDVFYHAYPDLCKLKVEPMKSEIKKRLQGGDLVIGAKIEERNNMVIG